MTRYVRQQDTFSCGPVALLNALKWMGQRATWDDLPRLSKECDCKRPHGTPPHNFHQAARKILGESLLSDFYLVNPRKKQLDQFLKDPDHALIVNFGGVHGSRLVGHYVFVPGRWKSLYMVVNASHSRTTLSYFTPERFARTCLCRIPVLKPKVWLLSRPAPRPPDPRCWPAPQSKPSAPPT